MTNPLTVAEMFFLFQDIDPDDQDYEVAQRLINDRRMNDIWRELLKFDGGRQRGIARYGFGLATYRERWRDTSVAFKARADREITDSDKEFWITAALHMDEVVLFPDDDAAVYAVLETVWHSRFTTAIRKSDSHRMWPLWVRRKLNMRAPNLIDRARMPLHITGFCVSVAQTTCDLTGNPMAGTVAALCEVVHGIAPTRAAVHKMTIGIKPLKMRSKIVC